MPFTWQLWIASLKKSSRRRLSRLGFLSNAALMLPRNLDSSWINQVPTKTEYLLLMMQPPLHISAMPP